MDRLISEQAVLDVLNEANRVGRFYCGKNRTIEEIKAIPSVESKTGHWINIDATHSKCDRCEAVFEIASSNGEINYCPNCGAMMIEPQESEDEG